MTNEALQNTLAEIEFLLKSAADPKNSSESARKVSEAINRLEFLKNLVADELSADRLYMLYQISQALSSSLELEKVLESAMDAVIELTGAERGYLLLLDPDTQQLEVKAARGLRKEFLETRAAGFSRTVIRTVVEKDAGLVTTDAQNDPRFAEQKSVSLQALRSILCVPLRWGGQIIGVVYVDNRVEAGVFQRKDLTLLESFALQAAVAIANARLYSLTDRRLAERVTELEMLAQMDRQLNSTLDLTEVATLTLRWAVQETGASDGWIALVEPDEKELLILTGEHAGEAVDPQDDVLYECWQTGRMQNVPPQFGQPARAIVPLLRVDKPTGVLVVERDTLFSRQALQFLLRLAGHAVFAIDNAWLHQRLQETIKAKSKFISFVVHELRIPMTAIKGYADLLRQGAVGPVNEAQVNFLDVIRNNVGRMAALTSDLSDINRVESGRMKLELAQVSIAKILQDAVKSLRPNFSERNHSLKVEIAADLPQISADSQRLEQVISNLLINAWKYTPEGGTVHVRAFETQLAEKTSAVRIEVQDNGIGILASDQQKLFTPFFRSEVPEVREQQGWGLGLSVSRSLVELMGGQIGFESESEHDQGSTFWVVLPVEGVKAALDPASSESG